MAQGATPFVVAWAGQVPVVAEAKEILAEQAILAKDLPTPPSPLSRVTCRLPGKRGPIEFMVYSQDGGRAALDEVVIERR